MLNKELTLSVRKAPVLEIRFAEANKCYVRYQDKTNRQQFAWAKYGLGKLFKNPCYQAGWNKNVPFSFS